MRIISCPHCGSIDVFVANDGPHVGEYCGGCGKWIKWAGKEEARLVQRQQEMYKDDRIREIVFVLTGVKLGRSTTEEKA